jgi:hypothetical protein
MATEIRLWKIKDNHLKAIRSGRLDFEERLEAWLEEDISLVSQDLLVIGNQVQTDYGGMIDLLCLDEKGEAVIVELKRDKTPREIVAQTLDYASWVKDLSNEKISDLADRYLQVRCQKNLEEAFREKFKGELPEVLNEGHSLLIVACQIDAATERIIKYLSDTYGVGINAVTFQYFKEESGDEHVARTFLIQPSQVEQKTQDRKSSKRSPRLTVEELQELATEKGVGELYGRLVSVMMDHLIKGTARTAISFYGKFETGYKSIFVLIPAESSQENGLKFHIYASRFSSYFKADNDAFMSMLPENREPWEYVRGAGEEFAGYAGYFQDEADVQKFLAGFKALVREPA